MNDTRQALAIRPAAPVAPNDPFTSEKIELIKQTVAKGATDLELNLFLARAQQAGLDPLARQIHFVKFGNQMSIQVGIDGYRLIADRTGQYCGNDDPICGAEIDVPGTQTTPAIKAPATATVTVWKLVGGHRCPYTATARWSEYFRDVGPMWRRMPYLMLGKTAEALALRKAFPAELSGLYTRDEMDQAGNVDPETGEILRLDSVGSGTAATKAVSASAGKASNGNVQVQAPRATLERLKALLETNGISSEQALDIARQRFSVSSAGQLTPAQAAAWIVDLERQRDAAAVAAVDGEFDELFTDAVAADEPAERVVENV